MSEEVKEESKFVSSIGQDGRVYVEVSGPHINKKTFNRLILAMKKTYRLNIRDYRKQVKRNMTALELSSITNDPTILEVKPKQAVKSLNVSAEVAEVAEVIETDPKEPIVVPVQDAPRRASLQEAIEAKRAKALAKAEDKK